MAFIVPLVFFWFVGAVMHHTQGHYDSSAGRFTIFFFVALAVMLWRPRAFGEFLAREKIRNFALAVAAVLGCYTLAHKPLMIYANDQSPWMPMFHALTWIAVVFAALLVPLALAPVENPKFQKLFIGVALAAVVSLVAAQCFVPILSPKPWIDVWVNNTAGVDHFLHGRNPYTQDYPDIYHGAYDYKAGFLYFPGILYWTAPFRWLLGDIRYGFVFANILIAGGAVFLSRHKQASWPTSLLFAILWLGFPVIFFVLEQAWIDPTLGAMAMLALLAVACRRWVICGLCLGGAVALKQYGCLIAFFSLIYIWHSNWRSRKDQGLRPVITTAVSAAVVALVAVLPFALWDFGSFYSSTVGDYSVSAPRLDAYNATIYFAREYGWLMPASGRLAFAALGIFGSAGLLLRRKRSDLSDVGLALFTSFGVAFLFGKWAFCNYYYLIASMLLVYLVSCQRSVRSGSIPIGLPPTQERLPEDFHSE
jgi:hypothetical protein